MRLRVSTHSRAEAAAVDRGFNATGALGFNTQPRGGGCSLTPLIEVKDLTVSTHSRAEAAA